MKISIVIPVYNVEPWVESSLTSVLDQDYPDIECIVVDDRGNDNSMDIVRRVISEHSRGNTVKIITHEVNRELAVARNTGTAAATGDYIFYLDSDDALYDSGAISAFAAAAAEHEPDIVQGNYLRIDPETGSQTISSYHNPSHPFYNYDEIIDSYKDLNFANATNKLISKKFLSKNNISFKEKLIYEDALWGFRVYIRIGSLATIPEITYCHNLRQGSIMRSPASEKKIDSLIYIIGQMRQSKRRDPNICRDVCANAVYTLKLLFTEDFPKNLRRSKLHEIFSTGVRKAKCDRKSLPPFSKRLSYALLMPEIVAFAYCSAIGSLYKSWKNHKQGS